MTTAITCKHINTHYDVHRDDVHAMVFLEDEKTIVTGSKDGTHAAWKFPGLERVAQIAAGHIDYKKWITAIAPYTNDSFFIGTRDGRVEQHDLTGMGMTIMANQSTENIPGCKERNQSRIDCLTFEKPNLLFIGRAKGFLEYDLARKEIVSQCQTSDRDWVYCFRLLTPDTALVVTGTELELFKKVQTNWDKIALIQTASHAQKKATHRPFISSILPFVEGNPFVATATFDGSVRVHDLTCCKEFIRYNEHQGRVWKVENLLFPQVIVSGADDATVRIYDIRQRKSVFCMTGFLGRVANLLTSGNFLLSSSCAENVVKSNSKAEISLWDLRFPSAAAAQARKS